MAPFLTPSRIIRSSALLAAAVFSLAAPALAAFSLSVSPYEGGRDLDFGKVGRVIEAVNKELVFRVDSSIGKQYRIIQQMQEPLSNAEGIIIPPQNLVVYSVQGSNAGGTLAVDYETPVANFPQVLFTSMTNGSSVTFTLAYALRGPFSIPSGQYRGRMMFSLEALDGSAAPVRVYTNFFAEIEAGQTVEIKTDTGRFIRLSNEQDLTRTKEVYFGLAAASFGTPTSITQELTGPLRSADGEELSPESVTFYLLDLKKGSGPLQPEPLSLSESTLYRSEPSGAADSFSVVYALNEPDKVKAGKYTSGLRYSSVSNRGMENLGTFPLEILIEKIFTLDIKTESGTGSISFRDLKPGQPPRTYELTISPRSNVGKKYQVTQRLFSELVNKEGKKVPQANFTVRTEAFKETRGTVKIPQKEPMEVGEKTLFISDKTGTSDVFKLIYDLEVPNDLVAGDYSTSLTFSISEL